MQEIRQTLGPVVGVQGVNGPLLPVSFMQEICETQDNLRANIAACLKRDYTPFTEYLSGAHKRVASLCGSGPSIADTLPQITGDVFACNAAHDYLLSNGVKPRYAMLFDAAQMIVKFIEKPQDGVTYLIASRCHPDVIDHFQGSDCVIWHADGDGCTHEELEKADRPEPVINGGTAAVTRGLFVLYAMGYRTIHVHGADSSFRNGETHIRKSLADEQTLRVFCYGRWFETAPWMAVQIEDFKLIAPALRDAGVRIVVHGTGLLPFVAGILGFEVTDEGIKQEILNAPETAISQHLGPDYNSRQEAA
jgi:hypothetical protein